MSGIEWTAQIVTGVGATAAATVLWYSIRNWIKERNKTIITLQKSGAKDKIEIELPGTKLDEARMNELKAELEKMLNDGHND